MTNALGIETVHRLALLFMVTFLESGVSWCDLEPCLVGTLGVR